MVHIGRGVLGLLFVLLLSGCFLVPGKFVSNLDIRKDGSFSFAYRGEIAVLNPDALGSARSRPRIWSDAMAKCFDNGTNYADQWAVNDEGEKMMPPAPPPVISVPRPDRSDDATMRSDPGAPASQAPASRPCRPAEIAQLRKGYEAEQKLSAERQKREGDQMAAMFGLGPNNDETGRKLAASLLKFDGWKAATYRGKGVYDVDYLITGRIGHDFIFPVFPQGDILIPFVSIRSRADGAVLVSAPAYTGGGLKGIGARMQMLGMGRGDMKDMPQSAVQTAGRFTITTDGVPLTNNTDDGATAGTSGQMLTWNIDTNSEKIPEALIRLR